MSIEFSDIDSFSDVSHHLEWALETGIWDGRKVSWMDASTFHREVQTRILQFLFENVEHPYFENVLAQFAKLGPENKQTLLHKDIQKLDFSKSDLILQAGLKKSLSKFWKKHKKEILIGIAVAAVVTVVVVIAVSAAGAAAAAGGAVLGSSPNKDEKEKLPNLSKNESSPQNIAQNPTPPDLSLKKDQIVFGETGITFDGQYNSYRSILLNQSEPIPLYPLPEYIIFPFGKPSDSTSPLVSVNPPLSYTPWMQSFPSFMEELYPTPSSKSLDLENQPILPLEKPSPQDTELSPDFGKKSWMIDFLQTIGKDVIDSPDLFDPDIPLPSAPLSSFFSTLGKRETHLRIGGGNGMNTTYEEAVAHANHLAEFTNGHCIDWVYNHSHGPVIDMAEILTLNLAGYSPNTANLHLMNWTEFHKANDDKPDAKYLQFCHSQDTIHVYNALEKAPEEVRQRVIVVAFGPAVIIPDGLCFSADHYACKGDVVPQGEVAYAWSIGGILRALPALEKQKKLIWVDPHPDTKSPHDFQNPAFDKIKSDLIREYLDKNGEYK